MLDFVVHLVKRIFPMNMEARHQIIDFSVQTEYNFSMFLSGYLGIDRDSSRSLSNRSTKLSFNQQLNLILDMNILNKEEVKKLESFAQIRNKFAHVVEIKTYNQCLSSDSTLKNSIDKLYPISIPIDDEIDSTYQVVKLLSDIVIIGDKIINKLKIKVET